MSADAARAGVCTPRKGGDIVPQFGEVTLDGVRASQKRKSPSKYPLEELL